MILPVFLVSIVAVVFCGVSTLLSAQAGVPNDVSTMAAPRRPANIFLNFFMLFSSLISFSLLLCYVRPAGVTCQSRFFFVSYVWSIVPPF